MNWDWMKEIEKGDVLESGSGVLRVVRDVKHGEKISHTYVTFSILHCSWTGRPYTVVDGNVLRQQGYRPTGIKGYPLRTKLDRAIEREIHGRDGMPLLGPDRETFCCDVRGIT